MRPLGLSDVVRLPRSMGARACAPGCRPRPQVLTHRSRRSIRHRNAVSPSVKANTRASRARYVVVSSIHASMDLQPRTVHAAGRSGASAQLFGSAPILSTLAVRHCAPQRRSRAWRPDPGPVKSLHREDAPRIEIARRAAVDSAMSLRCLQAGYCDALRLRVSQHDESMRQRALAHHEVDINLSAPAAER